MSTAWWGREAGPGDRPQLVAGPQGSRPELARAEVGAVRAAVRDRVAAFTPDWTNLSGADAGLALVRLFGHQLEPVLRRLNRLPERALVEFVAAAGVRPLPATPAETLLQFTIAPAAEESVFVPEGVQVGAAAATPGGDRVTFETLASVWATPAEIAEVHVQEGGLVGEVQLPEQGGSFLPFGRRPRPGRALWIGLDGPAPTRALAFGIVVAAPPGAPPPAAAGGLVPMPALAAPLLRWEVIDAGSPAPTELLLDETGGLVRSGVIELGVPQRWRPGRPAVLGDGEDRRWLRARIVHGAFPSPPSFASVFLNAVRAAALRTIRNEALETVAARAAGGRTIMRLSQTPIVPGSIVLEVDEGIATDVFGVAAEDTEAGSSVRRWEEVEDLSAAGPEDRVFSVDAASGEVTFGDGTNGARVPPGFRNVVALRYRVGGGAAGAVAADEAKAMVTSVPFVSAVTNPIPASGGTDSEPVERVVRRGPQEVRARGRAVTAKDYELLATRSPGADVARAYAVPGHHPGFPGRPVPGVVAVFLIPPDRGEGPPTPDEGSLRAVGRHLSREVAPAGVEIVSAAPRYHSVRVETQVVIDRAADGGSVVRRVVDAIDGYLHPLTGGESGQGWPFGGPLRYSPLVQRLLALSDVRAVPRLDFVVDGIRALPCKDYPISPNALVWPEGHEVVPQVEAKQ